MLSCLAGRNKREVPGKWDAGNISAICSTLFSRVIRGLSGLASRNDHRGILFLRELKGKMLNRVLQVPWLKVCISHCHLIAAVAEDLRDAIEIYTSLNHPGRGGVSEVMEPEPVEFCFEHCGPEGIPDPPVSSLEQDMWDALFAFLPPPIQDGQEIVRDWYMSSLIGFC